MALKNLVVLLILLGISSCAENTGSSNSPANPAEKLLPGFSIKNGPRQGFRYVDSNETVYVYYYITTTITNDSTIPMHLIINFSKANNHANDSTRSPVFLLPRRSLIPAEQLVPVRNQIDMGMSKELKWFLDRVTEIPVSLDTVLNSKGKCVMTFGILNDTKYAEPYGIGLKASPESSSKVTLGLSFDRIPNDHYLIPCGQISFTDN